MSSVNVDPSAAFAAAIFEPTDIVEVRALRGRGESAQEWCVASELLDPASSIRLWIGRHTAARWNIYVGANPRKAHGGSTAADVALARAHFVDFDGVMPEDAFRQIAEAGLPDPSIVIASGHGCHAYWRLAEPVTDLDRWTGVQKRLISKLGTDRVVHDAPRIMRLPGTVNWKREPGTPCTLLTCRTEAVTLSLTPITPGERAPEPSRPTASMTDHPKLSRATLTYLQFGACEGERNSALFKAACDILGSGMDVEAAREMLMPPARKSGLDDWEIEGAITSAASKSRTPSCPPGDDAGSDASSQRDMVLELARASYRFGRSKSDEFFAVAKDGPNIARMLRSPKGGLRGELARQYYLLNKSALNGSAMTDAMLVLEGECFVAEPEEVHLRVGRHGDDIVIDLGDQSGRAIVVTKTGWGVVDRSPILFKRTALTGTLPIPVRGGSLDLLRSKLNLSPDTYPLAVACLVASFIPDIEHPIVLIGGPQDAGKSTAARVLVSLVDPSPAPLRCPPRDQEQWSVNAAASWWVVLDNISGISEWLSDAFCRAVTGEGLPKRALYTDDGLSVLTFRRCVMLTSIDTGTLKGDLGRRLVLLDLVARTGKKVPPRLFAARHEQDRPAILGALLDVLVAVLRVMPTIELDDYLGLADFEQVLGALDVVRGTKTVETYRSQWGRLATDVVDDDPVASAVRTFALTECAENGEWRGTTGELLSRLVVPNPRPKGWPDSSRGLAGRLRRAAPALLAVGIEVIAPAETAKKRVYVLRTAPTARPPTSSSDPTIGGPLGGCDPFINPDPPTDRPTQNPCSDAVEAGSGRLGGQGDWLHTTSYRGPCRVCGTQRWWVPLEDDPAKPTCGTCHPPEMPVEQFRWLEVTP